MSEAEARQWLLDIASVIGRGATLTGTQIDDAAVAAFKQAIENDFFWMWIWKLLQRILQGEQLVGTEDMDGSVVEASEAVGIDPATIIAIITAVIELIKFFRRDK